MAIASYLVWGAGGHGKVVAEAMRASGMDVAGFIDSDPSKLGTVVDSAQAGVKLTESDFLISAATRLPEGISGIALGVGDNTQRARCRSLIPLHVFVTVVHPSAVVSPHATLEPGSVVLAGAIVNSDARIGAGAVINTGAIVEHDCDVQEDAHVAPGAVLAGNVTLGRRVLVGAGSVIIPGVSVGDEAIVGAGSVVIRDVEESSIVAGNPARPISRKP